MDSAVGSWVSGAESALAGVSGLEVGVEARSCSSFSFMLARFCSSLRRLLSIVPHTG